jgi:hypothetical protein
MRTNQTLIQISVGVKVLKLVKVRSYKRRRRGKIEKVKSHYRRY